MHRLKAAMLLLMANEAPLGPEWVGHRECHIGGDFLLTYKLETGARHDTIVFVRAGTHADLFE